MSPDPETSRRIELLSRAEVALAQVKHALDSATRDINYVVPQDHQLAKAMADLRLALAKADTLNTDLLKRFKR